MYPHTACILGLLAQTTAPSAAETPVDTRFAALRDELVERVAAGKISSLAVLVIDGGEVVWEQGFGWQDAQRQVPTSTATIYPIASISKSLTGLAVALLVEDGSLSLDDEVDEVLRSFRLQRAEHLESGPLLVHLAEMSVPVGHGMVALKTAPESIDAASERATADKARMSAEGGHGFHYGNYAAGLLERIVADVSDQTFEQFLTERVLLPLGMTSTSVWPRPQDHDRVVAAAAPPEVYLPTGGVGMYSTVQDLAVYARLHLTPERFDLPPGAVRLARHSPTPSAETGPQYWLGWGVIDVGGTAVALTDGQVSTCTSAITLCDERDAAVICLTDTLAGRGFERLADEIALRGMDVLVPGMADAYRRAAAAAGD